MQKILHWTQHSKMKMRQYNLSKSRLLRVLLQPKRVEKGIVPRTIAVMQPSSSPVEKFRKSNSKSGKAHSKFFYGARRKEKGEIWLMYQDRRNKRIIITAWRYPTISPIGEEIPIPEDIKQFLKEYKT